MQLAHQSVLPIVAVEQGAGLALLRRAVGIDPPRRRRAHQQAQRCCEQEKEAGRSKAAGTGHPDAVCVGIEGVVSLCWRSKGAGEGGSRASDEQLQEGTCVFSNLRIQRKGKIYLGSFFMG
jgi:hypothetical protein